MKTLITLFLTFAALPALSADITIEDAYARGSRPGAPTGAMFMTINNAGDHADRLVSVASPAAQIVELHTHIEEDGIMKMRPVEDGIPIPASGTHVLERGGDHVMLMGLTLPFETGASVPLTLTFEGAGEKQIEVPVDNDREQGRHDKTGGEGS